MTDIKSREMVGGSPETVVVLVNYFGADDTEACIESLVNSSPAQSVVVVDNSPHDQRLRSVLERYPEVHGIFPEENLGFGRGNNLGVAWALEHTDCRFFFLLNNDTRVDPDCVARLQAAMEVYPDVGVVVPRIVLAEDRDKLWYAGGSVDWVRGGSRVDSFMQPADSTLAERRRFIDFASGCAMFLRREVLVATNGFDPRFFMYEEDLELSIRIIELGWKILYVPGALIEHRVQGSMREKGQTFTGKWDVRNPSYDFHAYHMTRNKLLNALIHARGLDAVKFSLSFPLYLLRKVSPHLLRLRFRALLPVLRGLRDGIVAFRFKKSGGSLADELP